MRLSRIAGLLSTGVKWQKYNCEQGTSAYTTYTEGAWSSWAMGSSGMDWRVYPSYSFNRNTGNFTLTGSSFIIGPNNPGQGYLYGGSTLVEAAETVTGDFRTRTKGSIANTIHAVYYTRGSYIGSVYAKKEAYPDANKGYTYVSTFSDGGISYTVMTDGSGNYYAYSPA